MIYSTFDGTGCDFEYSFIDPPVLFFEYLILFLYSLCLMNVLPLATFQA